VLYNAYRMKPSFLALTRLETFRNLVRHKQEPDGSLYIVDMYPRIIGGVNWTREGVILRTPLFSKRFDKNLEEVINTYYT